jgi:hypothetical protein
MYKEKYLKYKTKYLDLKNQIGGGLKQYSSFIKSKDFATEYKKQNRDSKIVNFKFYIKKDYSTTKYEIDDTNDKGTMLLDHYFIYHENETYMSYTGSPGSPSYSPKLISSNVNINRFLIYFHLLLILIENLNLDKQNKSDFLTYLLRIASCIQIFFDINLKIDDIILQYLGILEMVKQNPDINKQYSWTFFISVDDNIFNNSTMSIQNFFINHFKPDYNEITILWLSNIESNINDLARIRFKNLKDRVIFYKYNKEYTQYITEYDTKNIQQNSTDIHSILLTYINLRTYEKAAAEKAAAEKAAADKENAKINDINKSSKTFANAYKSQNINSHKINFKFIVTNYYHTSQEKKKHSVMVFDHFFIYDSDLKNIYMSDDTYSPIDYNKYFNTNGLTINKFFTTLIELLIYTWHLSLEMSKFLNGDKIEEFLNNLRPILTHIKFLFNIDLSEDDIRKNYKKDDINKDKGIIEEYTLLWFFLIDDMPLLNGSMTNMKTRLRLDDTIDGFAPGFFNTKNMETKDIFTRAVKQKADFCDQNKQDDNCREPRINFGL